MNTSEIQKETCKERSPEQANAPVQRWQADSIMDNSNNSKVRPDVTWEEFLASGELDGYEVGVGNQMDFEIATEEPCFICEGQMMYFAYFNERGSYRAFSVCRDCSDYVEF